MMKNSLQIGAVVVVLLTFAFVTISPMFGLNLNISPTLQALVMAIALALMFTMGIWYFWKKPRLQVLPVRAHRDS